MCGGEPTATSTPTPVYLLPVLKGIPTWKLPVEMKTQTEDVALKQNGQLRELSCNDLSSGRDMLSTSSITSIQGHLLVILEKSNFQMIVLE